MGSREESIPPDAWTESGRTPVLQESSNSRVGSAGITMRVLAPRGPALQATPCASRATASATRGPNMMGSLCIAPEHNAVVAVRDGEERRHGGLRLEVTSRQLTVTLGAHRPPDQTVCSTVAQSSRSSCSSKEPTPKHVHRRAPCESRSASLPGLLRVVWSTSPRSSEVG